MLAAAAALATFHQCRFRLPGAERAGVGRVKDTMVAGNVHSAQTCGCTRRRCGMERILLHPSLIVEGPSTRQAVKNNLCASCSDPALSPNGYDLDVQARSLKPVYWFGRGTIRRFAQSGAGWLGAWRVQASHLLPAGLYYQQSDFRSAARWLTAGAIGTRSAVAVFLTSSYAANANQPSWRGIVKLIPSRWVQATWGGKDQLCMWELPWPQLSRWFPPPRPPASNDLPVPVPG